MDASEFLNQLDKGATLKEERLEVDQDDSRSVNELLAAQVEFADTLILNKCDLVSRERVDELRALLTRMNPTAHLVEAVRSEVPLEEIVNTQRFKLEQAHNVDGFSTELTTPHFPETEEYGIGSLVFTSPKPFHPVRLHRLIFGDAPDDERHFAEASPLGKAYRSKGWFYLANALGCRLTWSGAGRSIQFEVAAERWLASMLPEHLWPLDDEEWQPLFGDRVQKLVIISPASHLPSIQTALDAALLTDDEIQNPDQWSAMDCNRLWELEDSSDDEESLKQSVQE